MSIIELKSFYNDIKLSIDKLNKETNNQVIDLTLQIINNKLEKFKSSEYDSTILHHLYEMDEEFPEYLLDHNMEYLSLLINGRTLSHIIELDNKYSIIYDFVDGQYTITKNSRLCDKHTQRSKKSLLLDEEYSDGSDENYSDEESDDDFTEDYSDEEFDDEFNNIGWTDPGFNETELNNWIDDNNKYRDDNQNVDWGPEDLDNSEASSEYWDDFETDNIWNNQYANINTSQTINNSSRKSERRCKTEIDEGRPGEKSDLLSVLSGSTISNNHKTENNIGNFDPEVDDLTGCESLIDKIKERKAKWEQIKKDELELRNKLENVEEIKIDGNISKKISLAEFKEKVKQKAKNKISEIKN